MISRKSKRIKFANSDTRRLVAWASQHEYFSILNGNDFSGIYGAFPQAIFVGRQQYVESSDDSFRRLKLLTSSSGDWFYGYFSYDLKNEIEPLLREYWFDNEDRANSQIENLLFI